MGKGDIEAGFSHAQENSNNLYPSMTESPELRWGFIRKVYMIISTQLLVTAAFASLFIFYPPVRNFARSKTLISFLIFFIAFIVTLIVLFALSKYYKKHPVNLFLLGLNTLSTAVTVGYACAFVKGMVVLEAALLTGAVVASLTIYTFWAVKRGHDFSFLGPFLFASVMVMFLFGIIQLLCPFGPAGRMVFSAVSAVLMCAFIVFDTNNLIKNYTYDEYIWAAISIYGDIINLFLSLLAMLNDF